MKCFLLIILLFTTLKIVLSTIIGLNISAISNDNENLLSEGLIVHSHAEILVVPDGELRHLAHPHTFLARLPADECFVVSELVAAVEVLDRHTEPVELCTKRHEAGTPVQHNLLDIGVDGFLIEEDDHEPGELDAVLLHRLDHHIGHADRILTA